MGKEMNMDADARVDAERLEELRRRLQAVGDRL